MDIRHFKFIATVACSLLVTTKVCAQYAEKTSASEVPAQNHERIATLAGSASAYRSGWSMTHAFSSDSADSVECIHCQGWIVEALMRWTDRLVTKLDPTGLVDTPFDATRRDQTQSGGVRPASEWRPVPRIRPIQLHGGYGLVARITF